MDAGVASRPLHTCVEREPESGGWPWVGSLDVHVKRLRAKVEPDPGGSKHLLTVRGLGYKFEP